jgi:hypothetical protein
VCAACGGRTLVLSAGRLCPRCSLAALDDVLGEGGFQLPGYHSLGELAHGGMGAVYKARQVRPEREVAVKVLLPQFAGDEEMLARFQIEARAMAGLEHPGILPVYEVGESGGTPFFSMKLATGGSLADRLARGPMTARAAAELLEQLARALHFAHQHGVLHRDLKPANFLFDDAGRAYVSDFGLAKLPPGSEGTALTRTQSIFGTPHYMPPEVAGGSVAKSTTAGDLYSLGAVLYECLTGRRPFFKHDGIAALLRAIVDIDVPPLRSLQPDVPGDLEIICLKALEKSPHARYASCGDFADDLRRWLDGRPILARPVSPLERLWRWAGRHPLAAALAAALVAVSALGGLLLAKSYQDRGAALEMANVQLRESYLNQARSQRLLAAPGHRRRALDLLQRAAGLRPGADLRNEAASLLGRADIEETTNPASAAPAWDASRSGAFPDDPMTSWRTDTKAEWSVSLHTSGRAALWKKDAKEPVHVWLPAAGHSVEAEFASGKLLLAGLEQGLQVLEPPFGGGSRILQPPGSRISFLAADPLGKRLAVARADGLEVLSLEDGAVLWRGGHEPVRCRPAWSADGSLLVTAPGESRQVACSTADGTPRWSVPLSDWPAAFSFHPSGQWLAVAASDQQVSLHSASTGRGILAFSCTVGELSFSPSGHHLRAASGTSGMRHWELREPEGWQEWTRLGAGEADGVVFSLALSPDGSLLLTSTTAGVRIWSVPKRAEVGFHPAANQRIDAPTAAFWLGNAEILVQVPGGLERVGLDTEGQPLPPRPVKRPPGSAVAAIQPDGSWIVRLTDPDAGEESWERWPHGDSARGLAWNEIPARPEPLTAISADGRQTARLLPGDRLSISARGAAEADEIILPEPLGARGLVFDQQGIRLILVSKEHRVFSWDMERLRAALRNAGF